MNNREVGNRGEDKAVDYLLNSGYRIITRNYGIKIGEIDIIAQYLDKTVVFVEVKYFRGSNLGAPEYKISPRKINRIKKVAEHYIKNNSITNQTRVDAISIWNSTIKHYQNISIY